MSGRKQVTKLVVTGRKRLQFIYKLVQKTDSMTAQEIHWAAILYSGFRYGSPNLREVSRLTLLYTGSQ